MVLIMVTSAHQWGWRQPLRPVNGFRADKGDAPNQPFCLLCISHLVCRYHRTSTRSCTVLLLTSCCRSKGSYHHAYYAVWHHLCVSRCSQELESLFFPKGVGGCLARAGLKVNGMGILVVAGSTLLSTVCVALPQHQEGAPKRLLQFLQELAPSCALSDAAAVVVSICRNR